MNGTARKITMAGHLKFSAVIALCLIGSQNANAQGPWPATVQQFGPSAVPIQQTGFNGDGAWPIGNWNVPGHNGPHVGLTDPRLPIQYATPQTAQPGVGYYGPDGYVTTRAPLDDDLLEESPLEGFLSRVVPQTWIRLEYLLYEIDEPGPQLLGAKPSTVFDPRVPFPVFDFQIPANQIGTATVPDLRDITLRDNNGIRGTWGVPLTFGQFEASIFALRQADDQLQVPGIRPATFVTLTPFVLDTPGRFSATGLFSGGQPSNIVELYNQSFSATFTSNIWGAEANVIFHGYKPGLGGLNLRPLVGVRFLSIQEQLTQEGIFDDGGILAPTLTSVIDSDTHNYFAGGTIGCRLELTHRWFSLGVEPKISLGTNSYRARVTTVNLRSTADGEVRTEDKHTTFGAVGEVGVFARAHVNENFSLHVGYTVTYLNRVTRPYDNIFYNDNGPAPIPPGVVNHTKLSTMQFEGISIGGEIRFK